MGWTEGKKNGELLRAAELAGYAVLLTVDQGMVQQQNMAGRALAVVVIRSRTKQLEDLLRLVEEILRAIKQYRLARLYWSHSDSLRLLLPRHKDMEMFVV